MTDDGADAAAGRGAAEPGDAPHPLTADAERRMTLELRIAEERTEWEAETERLVAEERRRCEERVAQLEAEFRSLREKGAAAAAAAASGGASTSCTATEIPEDTIQPPLSADPVVSELTPAQITRYSRQLLLSDGFGVSGQRKLLSSSVLVIGAGGIGSTVLPYLAASGVGSITVVDFDSVDKSNLHRQIIHEDGSVGSNKAESACRALRALNPTVRCTAVSDPLTSRNALDLAAGHDVVVDASDNPKTRYLINDACVLAGRPLVSGSAMGTEGQLTVYGCGVDGRPCYRCLYPRANPDEGCKSCSDNGVLGPVPGLIGVLQATEVLKVLTGIGSPMYDRLLMYDSLQCSFLSIKKPPANRACPVCSTDATIKDMVDSAADSRNARGPSVNIDAAIDTNGTSTPTAAVPNGGLVMNLPEELHISCRDYDELRKANTPHVLLDVRVRRQYDMCSLGGAVNIPLGDVEENLDRIEVLSGGTRPVYCLCRRGVASAEATRILSSIVSNGQRPGIHSVRNIRGGLNAWVDEVDPSFPKY